MFHTSESKHFRKIIGHFTDNSHETRADSIIFWHKDNTYNDFTYNKFIYNDNTDNT